MPRIPLTFAPCAPPEETVERQYGRGEVDGLPSVFTTFETSDGQWLYLHRTDRTGTVDTGWWRAAMPPPWRTAGGSSVALSGNDAVCTVTLHHNLAKPRPNGEGQGVVVGVVVQRVGDQFHAPGVTTPGAEPADPTSGPTVDQLLQGLGDALHGVGPQAHNVRDGMGALVQDIIARALVALVAAGGLFYQGAGPFQRISETSYQSDTNSLRDWGVPRGQAAVDAVAVREALHGNREPDKAELDTLLREMYALLGMMNPNERA